MIRSQVFSENLNRPSEDCPLSGGGDVEVSAYVGEISRAKMSEVKNCNAYWFSRESLLSIRLSNITKDVLNVYFSEG